MSSEQPARSHSAADPAIRVLIVDDHPLLRDGVEALINVQPDMKLVAQASNGREGVEEYFRHLPDITLMDMQMPEKSGIEALIAIRKKSSDARIIILTTHSGDVQTRRAMEAGAKAYLLKNSRTPGTVGHHPRGACWRQDSVSRYCRRTCGTFGCRPSHAA